MQTNKKFPGYQTKELTDKVKSEIISRCEDKYMDDLHNLYYDYRDYFEDRWAFYRLIDKHVIHAFYVSTGVRSGVNPAYDENPNMVSVNGIMCDVYYIKAPKASKIVSIGKHPDPNTDQREILGGRYTTKVDGNIANIIIP